MSKIDRLKHQSEIGGPNVVELLANLDVHIQDPEFKLSVGNSLKNLADLTFALDESSIVAITDQKGKIQYVNKRFCQISKYSKEELIGEDHRIINSGHHSKEFMRKLWKTIGTGQVWHGEIKNKAKDGSYYWVNTTIVPFLDDNGKPYQYLAIRDEVTKLKEVQEELKIMMNRVIGIQEEERKRISRELHDGIGQSMFALLIQLDQLINEKQDEKLEELRQNVSFMMEDIRVLAWELRPSVLDDLGVVPAIRKYVENYSQHYGIHVDLECTLRTRLDIQKETTIYRVIQEALTNIGKYANVSEAVVTIHELDAMVEVVVKDEGQGFIRESKGNGVGLFSMEERARNVGGTFEIQSELGRGTEVRFTVPKSN
ncbi:PAS domain-containing sensor histidine kinase [Ferdinandcohnia quinoae]|uniref:Oxygen sensor histidine kinase NreB n=1 Tax=Fredinandcohnia quinoae TaxID=2918902 RepID=A0AAW5E2X0_9BACI|nr:PAS domain-containing sensor histidine kinase [Fredinandcohnia sp. SECRCQ15]MCH1624336.1 PAS domain-containing sensor histidine kinase [Fredinandcohnia sp. SECRCQ15]